MSILLRGIVKVPLLAAWLQGLQASPPAKLKLPPELNVFNGNILNKV